MGSAAVDDLATEKSALCLEEATSAKPQVATKELPGVEFERIPTPKRVAPTGLEDTQPR